MSSVPLEITTNDVDVKDNDDTVDDDTDDAILGLRFYIITFLCSHSFCYRSASFST
jgi:hypothetical protein